MIKIIKNSRKYQDVELPDGYFIYLKKDFDKYCKLPNYESYYNEQTDDFDIDLFRKQIDPFIAYDFIGFIGGRPIFKGRYLNWKEGGKEGWFDLLSELEKEEALFRLDEWRSL